MLRGKIIIRVGMVLGLCCLFGTANASAADTTTIRVISTTDLHNQISSADYESASTNHTASLAKLNTMIKGARQELTEGGSITVDAGDSIYGYGAEYVMNRNTNSLQPIYKAMSLVGYDAITLGNHDFDYGYGFIKNQLNISGLSKLCLVSNVTDLSTGKNAWASTRIVTRTVKTVNGKQVKIKIGIVGATRPAMSSYYDYDGILESSGVMSNVKRCADSLKKQGVDVVVALVHSGMGDNTSTDASDDVAYALTKLANVDCVVCGHEHRNFPSSDPNASRYYKNPNVDKNTGLMNGKPVIMVADHAKGIGVADLTLRVDGSKVQVTGAKAEIRGCSSDVISDPDIEAVTNSYNEGIQAIYDQVIAQLQEGDSITSFFGLTEDNYGIQLNNEAKIRYGLQFKASREGKKYASYPVIATTKLYLDGSEGSDDYINISGDITKRDLLNIQRYEHNTNSMYWITGAQLKAWLEWSASIYATSTGSFASDQVMEKLIRENKTASLVSNAWSTNWGQYAIFDGIEYEIDATQPARYNHGGTVIDKNANRIKNLTCNGVAVTDNMKFLLVSNVISKLNAVYGGLTQQRITKRSPLNTVDYLEQYVKEMGSFGPIAVQPDHNWWVNTGGSRIVRSSILSDPFAAMHTWYQKTLELTDDFSYLLADFAEEREADTYGPLLVVAPTITVTTNQSIPVRVQATDGSGVQYCKYLSGVYEETDDKWKTAAVVKNNQVTIKSNGKYTFLAVDKKGNRTVRSITISNINTKVLQAPEVDEPSNKKKAITGYALSGVTIRIQIGSKSYNTTARSDGSFSCTVGKHSVGATAKVYAEDRSGRKSAVVKVQFQRGGPNSPTLNTVTNKTKTLTGKINDKNSTMMVFVGSQYVYVPRKGGTAVYKTCKKYTKKRKIKLANYSVSKGKYKITIPEQVAGRNITVFSVDIRGRVSLITSRKVKSAAPNKPQVNAVCDAEKAVSGKIPSAKKACNVTVTVSGKKYTSKSKKSGKFEVKTPALKTGMKLSVYASDTSKGKKRKSASAACTVTSKQKYVSASGKTKITVKQVTTRTKQITGTAKAGTYLYLNTGGIYTRLDVNKDGRFYYTLPYTLEAEKVIYLVDRQKSGKINEVKQIKVKAVKPLKPVIEQKTVTAKTKKLTILSQEHAMLVVKIGAKTSYISKCKYSKAKKAYVYTVKLPASKKNQKIVCYLKNSVGNGAKAFVIRRKA